MSQPKMSLLLQMLAITVLSFFPFFQVNTTLLHNLVEEKCMPLRIQGNGAEQIGAID